MTTLIDRWECNFCFATWFFTLLSHFLFSLKSELFYKKVEKKCVKKRIRNGTHCVSIKICAVWYWSSFFCMIKIYVTLCVLKNEHVVWLFNEKIYSRSNKKVFRFARKKIFHIRTVGMITIILIAIYSFKWNVFFCNKIKFPGITNNLRNCSKQINCRQRVYFSVEFVQQGIANVTDTWKRIMNNYNARIICCNKRELYYYINLYRTIWMRFLLLLLRSKHSFE